MFRHIPGIKTGGAYEVDQSVYVGDYGTSGKMERVMDATPSGPDFTISTWIKMGAPNANALPVFFILTPGGSQFDYAMEVMRNHLDFRSNSPSFGVNIVENFVDNYPVYSNWTHLTFTKSGNDYTVYLNGIEAGTHTVSGIPDRTSGTQFYAASGYWAGAAGAAYQADFHFIDGQALGPEHFALPNEDGDYLPTPYEGTYGNNGFHLEFDDDSIGADSSGNGNDFTVTGITPDNIVADSPTNNWCTFNPSTQYSQPGNDVGDLYHGNLGLRGSEASLGGYTYTPGTMNLGQGKWYFEAKVVDVQTSYLGIHDINNTEWGPPGNNPGNVLWNPAKGALYRPPAPVQYPDAICINGDIAGMAFDMVNETVELFIDGISEYGPVSWTGLAMPVETYQPLFAPMGRPSGGSGNKPYAAEAVINFGQRPWAYDPPEGYLAINSQNMENT